MRPFLSFPCFLFFTFFLCVSRQTEQLAAGCVSVCVQYERVCVCVCVCGRVACMKRELDVNDNELSNSLFFYFLQHMSFPDSWRQRQSICSYISPSRPSMRWCLYILILTADIRIKYWSYTHYVQLLLTPPSWSLYSFIKINRPSKQFICLHIKIPYLHDKSPQQRKCNVFFCL